MAKARTGRAQQQPPPDDDDDGDDEFTDAQLGRIAQLVNAAVSGQLQRKLPKAITDGITGPLGELKTLIEANSRGGRRVAANDDNDDDHDDADEEPPPAKRGGKGKRSSREDPEVVSLRNRVAAMDQERKTERAQNAARMRDTELREHLTKAGVDPNRIRGAIAVLRDSTKCDEKTGEWSYTAKRDGFDEDLDLGVGVGEWAKTDEGKSYIAAPATGTRGGSGTRVASGGVIGSSGGRAASGAGSGDPKAAKTATKQAAMQALTEGVNALAGGAVTIG